MAVGRTQQQGLQDQHIEGTLQHVSFGSRCFRHDLIHLTLYDALVELWINDLADLLMNKSALDEAIYTKGAAPGFRSRRRCCCWLAKRVPTNYVDLNGN